MILPLIHSNGTGRDALIQQRCAAYNALRNALKALADMSPHPRDYYLTPGIWPTASTQHQERMTYIRKLADEIEQEAIALDSQ